jgi:hypothetical protein
MGHMQLASITASPPRPALPTSFGARAGGRTSSPADGLDPELDALGQAQARFRIEGSGPLAERRIVPVSDGARELVGMSPKVTDSVRGVLRLLEQAAGGPAASAGVHLNGIALANSPQGHGANTYRAHVEDDPKFLASFSRIGRSGRADAIRRFGDGVVAESLQTHANVAADWVNVGVTASGALLRTAGIVLPGYNDAIGEDQLGFAVRVLRHEAAHVADQSAPRLQPGGAMGLREALAESQSRGMGSLRAARTALGLDGMVGDDSLARASDFRTYQGVEQILAGALAVSGIDPSSDAAAQLVARPSDQVAETLVTRLAQAGHTTDADARATLGAEFARNLGRQVS